MDIGDIVEGPRSKLPIVIVRRDGPTQRIGRYLRDDQNPHRSDEEDRFGRFAVNLDSAPYPTDKLTDEDRLRAMKYVMQEHTGHVSKV